MLRRFFYVVIKRDMLPNKCCKNCKIVVLKNCKADQYSNEVSTSIQPRIKLINKNLDGNQVAKSSNAKKYPDGKRRCSYSLVRNSCGTFRRFFRTNTPSGKRKPLFRRTRRSSCFFTRSSFNPPVLTPPVRILVITTGR